MNSEPTSLRQRLVSRVNITRCPIFCTIPQVYSLLKQDGTARDASAAMPDLSPDEWRKLYTHMVYTISRALEAKIVLSASTTGGVLSAIFLFRFSAFLGAPERNGRRAARESAARPHFVLHDCQWGRSHSHWVSGCSRS